MFYNYVQPIFRTFQYQITFMRLNVVLHNKYKGIDSYKEIKNQFNFKLLAGLFTAVFKYGVFCRISNSYT